MEKAVLWLREKGLSTAAKKAGSSCPEGIVTSYIHHGSRLGVLVELNARPTRGAHEDFQQLARDIAMQIAGMAPLYVSRDDVPAEEVEVQKRLSRSTRSVTADRADRIPMIVEGKLEQVVTSRSACSSSRIGTPIEDRRPDHRQGGPARRNIRVARFSRMAVGDTATPNPTRPADRWPPRPPPRAGCC